MARHKGRRKVPEESYKEKDQILRGEMNRLRKEIKRLRKENDRLKNRDNELSEFFQEMEQQAEIETDNKIQTTKVCPECKHGNVTILEKLNGKVDYYFCNNPYCLARGPIK